MIYERHNQPLLSKRGFLLRLALHALIAFGIILASLTIGVLGYHWTERMGFVDALLNASMILGGMGPVSILHTQAGKFFASFYALFGGIVFLVVAGVLVAPVAHRFLHWLHLDDQSDLQDTHPK